MHAANGSSNSTPTPVESAPAVVLDNSIDTAPDAIDDYQQSTLSRVLSFTFALSMAILLVMFLYHFFTTDINPRQGLYQRWGDLYGHLNNPVPGPRK